MSRKNMTVVGMLVCLLFAAVPAMAQSSTPEPAPEVPLLTASTELFAEANFLVNVRSGPSTKYTVLGKVHIGDALDISGRLANNTWLRVNFNGHEGWVSANLFAVNGELGTAPEAEAGPNAELRQSATQTVVTKLNTIVVIPRGNTNLRTTPTTDADVLVIVPFNTELTVTGRTANNNWVRVTFNDQTGWISAGVLFFAQGNIANAPIIDENGNVVEPTSQPAPQPTSAPSA
ncbi:MAG: SH3 domain-containing protein [Anaerolineae bacterium]